MMSNALYFLTALMVAGVMGAGVWAYEESPNEAFEIAMARGAISVERR